MGCFSPIQAYRCIPDKNYPKGQVLFVEHKTKGRPYFPFKVPCGYCLGCRLEKSRQWAVRMAHEAQLHDENCFITLTFSDETLAKRAAEGVYGIKKRDLQLFMKKLRKEFYGKKIKFYACGEYGSRFGRPHYHACLFGVDFKDRERWGGSDQNPLFRSRTLERLWPHGFSSVGSFTFDTAAYVARYVTKKIYGQGATDHYRMDCGIQGESPYTGIEVEPEFALMSRRPGIGAEWYQKYHGDVFPGDRVVVRGREMKPPRYYDKLLERDYPRTHETISRRRLKALKRKQCQTLEFTPERLAVKQRVTELNLQSRKRTYED